MANNVAAISNSVLLGIHCCSDFCDLKYTKRYTIVLPVVMHRTRLCGPCIATIAGYMPVPCIFTACILYFYHVYEFAKSNVGHLSRRLKWAGYFSNLSHEKFKEVYYFLNRPDTIIYIVKIVVKILKRYLMANYEQRGF